RCGKWRWKWKPKAANGCGNGCRKSYKRKPTVWAAFFPQSGRQGWHRPAQTMHLRSAFGQVEVAVPYGQDPADRHWGCPMRERGQASETRVGRHEGRLGVFYVQEQGVRPGSGQLLEETGGSWQGEPLELGRRLHWEALRGGLARAQEVLTVADGAPWIWNVVS